MAPKSLSIPLAFFEEEAWIDQGRGARQFSQAAAELDLLQMAARGIDRPSVRELAKRWGWSRSAGHRMGQSWDAQHPGAFDVKETRGTVGGTKLGQEQAEIEWRLERCWQTHLKAHRWFYQHANGSTPPQPSITPEIKKAIRRALHEHDAERLGPEDRERWEKESPVRAAGGGIFYSEWHTGADPKNEAGTRYLEPWRPWIKRRGNADPIPTFAAIYFEHRQANGRG